LVGLVSLKHFTFICYQEQDACLNYKVKSECYNVEKMEMELHNPFTSASVQYLNTDKVTVVDL
jgi:hypothetical protein